MIRLLKKCPPSTRLRRAYDNGCPNASIKWLDFDRRRSIIAPIVSNEVQPTPASPSHFPPSLIALAYVVTFVLALLIDVPVSRWAHTTGLAPWMKSRWWITHVIRFPGNFIFTLAACAVMLAIAWTDGIRRGERLWRKSAIVLLAGLFSASNDPLKWIFGRIRPYQDVPPFELHPFKYGLMHSEAGFSFPSGDATLAFAAAMSLAITIPRLRWLWWTLAVIVGLERIAENAHYPSDVVAGAALGVIVAVFAKKLVSIFAKNDANMPKDTIIAS
jgi:membrane-associated phospholipid phosphatase